MIAASQPVQRASGATLLVVDARRRIRHAPRSSFVEHLQRGDLVIANDAATLPASLRGKHGPTGAAVGVRLAAPPPLKPEDVRRFSAIVFGEGDFHTRTEDRAAPPMLTAGDRLVLGPLRATVERTLGPPRPVSPHLHRSA